MSYEVVNYSDQNYWDDIVPMWIARRRPVVPKDWLPKNGVVFKDGDTPICAGFLMLTNTTLANICYVVSNPSVDKATRSECVNKMVAMLVAMGKEAGFKLIGFASNVEPMIARMVEEHGFTVYDKNVTVMGLGGFDICH